MTQSRDPDVAPVVIVGAGGHGRELLDTIAPTRSVRGFVDDAFGDPTKPSSQRVARLGVPVLGPVGWLESNPGAYALGIGTSALRRVLSERLDAAGCEVVGVIHRGASIGSDSRLGPGVVVFDRTVVTTNVTIGAHTHLNVGCAVQHDTTVGEFVQFSPGVFVNGDCVIGDDVFLGTGAIVTRGCTVGDSARVGAGAVVLGDVAPGETVVGVPAAPNARRSPLRPTGDHE